jgi:hypothetical protein
LFEAPLKIDRKLLEKRDAPEHWAKELGKTLEVLPLTATGKSEGMPGWCTSGDETLLDSPEVEWICGGINSKTPRHAAIWRQGHLLHFGFQESPAQLNASGRALLVNAIAYAARFRRDRPIAATPSGFVCPTYPRATLYLRKTLAADTATAKAAAPYLGAALRPELAKLEIGELRAWLAQHEGRLTADDKGLLALDPDAEALGKRIDRREDIAACIALLEDPERGAAAGRLLARRIPEGPGGESWGKWWKENEPFVFFTEVGGYRWHVDPLAKARGVPSAKLVGPERGG